MEHGLKHSKWNSRQVGEILNGSENTKAKFTLKKSLQFDGSL